MVRLRLTDAVNGRDRRDDHHIAPLENALGARQAHLFDVLVDRRVLLDEQVALRDIGLGLVVVVIADEILHRIVREELPELAVKLGCQGLVGGEHNGRATQAGDHIGHRERLARAGHAQKGLEHLAIEHALHQFVDRHRLVAGWRIGLEQLERGSREGDKPTGFGFRSDVDDFLHEGKPGTCGAPR